MDVSKSNKRVEELRLKHGRVALNAQLNSNTLPVQIDLIPASESVVFNERNIERYAFFFFPHSRTKNLRGRRELVNGEQKIVIKPTAGDKAYTNRTYKTLLALISLWFDNPNPDGIVEGYLADLCRIKRISARSGKNIQNTLMYLEALYDTVIDWTRAFDVDGTPTSLKKQRFLQEFEYTKGKKGDGQSFNRKFKLQIHPSIIYSLRQKLVNPVPAAVFDIRGEIPCIYFCLIDTMISLKTDGKPLEWSSVKSFEAMNLHDVPQYKYASKRKEMLLKIVGEIDGKKLTSGEVLKAKLLKTKDGKDWKIRHWKAATKYAPDLKRGMKVITTDKDEITYLAEEIAAVVGQEETHMQYYRKLCRYYPQQMIFRALSEFKEAKQLSRKPVKDHGRFFTYTMHLIAHQMGYDWIGKECTDACDLRKERQIPID